MGIEAMAMGAADGSVGRVDGDVVGDAATMEANAALRNIRYQDTDEGYRAMLHRLAEQSGIETPTQDPGHGRPDPPGQQTARTRSAPTKTGFPRATRTP
jgi:hypothetical protein